MGALETAWEDEGLSREAAVFELVTLRREARPYTYERDRRLRRKHCSVLNEDKLPCNGLRRCTRSRPACTCWGVVRG